MEVVKAINEAFQSFGSSLKPEISIFVCQYSGDVNYSVTCTRQGKQFKALEKKFNWKCKCFGFLENELLKTAFNAC